MSGKNNLLYYYDNALKSCQSTNSKNNSGVEYYKTQKDCQLNNQFQCIEEGKNTSRACTNVGSKKKDDKNRYFNTFNECQAVCFYNAENIKKRKALTSSTQLIKKLRANPLSPVNIAAPAAIAAPPPPPPGLIDAQKYVAGLSHLSFFQDASYSIVLCGYVPDIDYENLKVPSGTIDIEEFYNIIKQKNAPDSFKCFSLDFVFPFNRSCINVGDVLFNKTILKIKDMLTTGSNKLNNDYAETINGISKISDTIFGFISKHDEFKASIKQTILTMISTLSKILTLQKTVLTKREAEQVLEILHDLGLIYTLAQIIAFKFSAFIIDNMPKQTIKLINLMTFGSSAKRKFYRDQDTKNAYVKLDNFLTTYEKFHDYSPEKQKDTKEKSNIIGRGAYNDIFYPAKPCPSDKETTILIHEYGGLDQLVARCSNNGFEPSLNQAIIKELQRIDPDQKYLIYPMFTCPYTGCQYMLYAKSYVSVYSAFKKLKSKDLKFYIDIYNKMIKILNILHKNYYAHLDAHLDNFLIDIKSQSVKLIDFDRMKSFDESDKASKLQQEMEILLLSFKYFFENDLRDYNLAKMFFTEIGYTEFIN